MTEPTKSAHRGPHPHPLGEPDAGPPGRPAAAAQPGARRSRRARTTSPDLPNGLIQQEVSPEPEIEIPDEVREVYGLWRRRRCTAHAGSSAARYARAHLLQVRGRLARRLAQAEQRNPAGVRTRRPASKARHGDRGRPVGLGARARLLAVRARVRGVHGRLELRPEALPPGDDRDWGATVHRSPSDRTEAGRSQPRTRPARWGSRSPRPSRSPPATTSELRARLGAQPRCLHQTVIGQEAMAQMEMAGEEPDVVVGCVGGGSNFAGSTFPFVRRVLRGEAKTRFLAASRRPARRSPAASTATTSATRSGSRR